MKIIRRFKILHRFQNNLNQTETYHSDQNHLPQSEKNLDLPVSEYCVLHPESVAGFIVKPAPIVLPATPESYGGKVKIARCAARCEDGEIDVKKGEQIKYRQTISEGFGIQDIARSFVYPFKFMPVWISAR